MYEYKLVRKNEQQLSRWPGGSTRQFAIYPPGAAGAVSFDYDFEITSSTMDFEETEYTIYADYQRTLMIISGAVTLSHEDNTSVRLEPYQYTTFDGALLTHSKGCAADYELMVKKGCAAQLNTLNLAQGEVKQISLKQSPDHSHAYYGFYPAEESCEIQLAGETLCLKPGDHLSLILADNEKMEIQISGKGVVITPAIFFDPATSSCG